MNEPIWNPEQQKAIETKGGNLLVSAAAGSGKTAVLVERVIRILTDEENPVDADRLLIVTFTKAAAAEMRTRIRQTLSARILENPTDLRLRRQQLLMEHSHICTIDSFCTDVLTENFSRVGIHPDFRVADEQEISVLSPEVLEAVLEEKYREGDPAFSDLVELFRGGETGDNLPSAVLELYRFVRSLPHYQSWLTEKAALYTTSLPVSETGWGKILLGYADDVLKSCLLTNRKLLSLCTELDYKKYCESLLSDRDLLEHLQSRLQSGSWDDFVKELSLASFPSLRSEKGYDEAVKEHVGNLRDGYKKKIAELAKRFSSTEADFREDLADLAPQVRTLFDLVLAYDEAYFLKKQEKHLLDFTDLEQLTLAVLTEQGESGAFAPTKTAKELSARFDYILVDECQDVSQVQDSIFTALSRGDNLFFVGDVKQSIYRFRQAMPELFLEKRERWPLFDGAHFPATIVLGRNYRSRKNIADAVNFIFRQIMTKKATEMDYTAEEELIPEATFPEDGIIRNEFLLMEPAPGKTAVETEADAVAERIYNMVQEGLPITDKTGTHPCRYSDICLLFRVTKDKSAKYMAALRKKGIPCQNKKEQEGFLCQPEIIAVLDVLKAVDNPLLDIPLAGAMLSEVFAFTPDEVAKIRLLDRRGSLYAAVKKAALSGDGKAAAFLATLDELRRTAAYAGSDGVIERFYELTAFPALMRSCKNGAVKLGNLRLLVKYAADREAAGVHGLSRFLAFIEQLSDLKPADPPGTDADCVSILSVHGSKGLEFPVVFLCDTARDFHRAPTSIDPIFHAKLGYASCRRDKKTELRFATVPWNALSVESRRLALAEEMRILYVALTRAKENLILTACVSDAAGFLADLAESVDENRQKPEPFAVSDAKNPASWLLTALLRHPDAEEFRKIAGLSEKAVLPDGSRWTFSLLENGESEDMPDNAERTVSPALPDEKILETLRQREAFCYPYKAAETIPVKAGVSALTHGAIHKKLLFSAVPTKGELSGAGRGTALHTFMQFCDFSKAKEDPDAELARLVSLRFLTEKQAKTVNPEKIAAFFRSDLYARMEKAPWLERELRFVQSLPASELGYENASPEDKITVQGVADCVFEEDGKLVIVDYKTDFVENIEELRERYAGQLLMYRRLLSASLGKEAATAVIWSFCFGEELEV